MVYHKICICDPWEKKIFKLGRNWPRKFISRILDFGRGKFSSGRNSVKFCPIDLWFFANIFIWSGLKDLAIKNRCYFEKLWDQFLKIESPDFRGGLRGVPPEKKFNFFRSKIKFIYS